jgi:DNA-binding NarL/FixJ family response regulator
MNKANKKDSLTEREKAVLRCLKDGMTSRDIADILWISERTVKFHVCNIIRKLNASNRTQAVAVAMERSLFD